MKYIKVGINDNSELELIIEGLSVIEAIGFLEIAKTSMIDNKGE